ncbi:MAG: hypothetical protein NVS1B11_37050 [Terriglobales bacterium]
MTLDALELLSVTLQAPVPEQAPPQPPNEFFAAGVAVSATCVPLAKLALHVPGQLIPEGLLITVPEPTPDSETVNELP